MTKSNGVRQLAGVTDASPTAVLFFIIIGVLACNSQLLGCDLPCLPRRGGIMTLNPSILIRTQKLGKRETAPLDFHRSGVVGKGLLLLPHHLVKTQTWG